MAQSTQLKGDVWPKMRQTWHATSVLQKDQGWQRSHSQTAPNLEWRAVERDWSGT